jgi:hypothetical protein
MPSDIPKTRPAISRSRVIEVIERNQEDAFRRLRQAAVPEAQALLVMQRISSFCLQTLRELDVLYRQFEEMGAEEGRSEEHEHWLNDKSSALLLQVEAGIAEIVASTIRQTIDDLKNPPSPLPEVLSVSSRPSRPGWLAFLLSAVSFLVWLAGTTASLLVAWQLSGEFVLAAIGLLIPLVLWLKGGRFWWALIFPLSALGLEAWLLSWLYFVEGQP